MNDISSGQSGLLTSMLRDFRIGDASYCRTAVSGDWGIALPFERGIRFHFIASGQCWLRAADIEPILLERGDLALLPHGVSHDIASSKSGRADPISSLGPLSVSGNEYRLTLGTPGPTALIQCVTLAFLDASAEHIVAAMPTHLVLRANDYQRTQLASLLDIMAFELAADRPGSDSIRARLADAAISMIVRNWAESGAERPAWLRPGADEGILRTVEAVQREPGRAWTLPDLAAVAGMSRTVFVERFTGLMNTTPGRYLLETRMAQASRLFREGTSVAETAWRLGYSDGTALSRAYRKHTGRTPGATRKSAAAAAE